MSQSRAHIEIFCGSLAGHYPSRKKYLEYFSNFGFLMFLATQSSNLFMRGLRDFRGLPCNSLAGRTSSREKHLDKFFKIFALSVLATCPGDLLATWLNHENRVFCAYRSVFKCFQFFPLTFVSIHCLSCLNPFLNHNVHTQILIFFIFSIPLHQFSSKGMGSVSFSICVTYLVIYLLDCVFLLYIW